MALKIITSARNTRKMPTTDSPKDIQAIYDAYLDGEVPAQFGDCKYCDDYYCEGECQPNQFHVDLQSEIARKATNEKRS
ncbi:hypothetical protein LCGC14_0547460 [marine sediment metagenome]|uniref:Uncharacterized protein n=1 Tax=marine sediment metagenome TaxID=412755 RepID=A0A0F9UZA6_9ZZZZ